MNADKRVCVCVSIYTYCTDTNVSRKWVRQWEYAYRLRIFKFESVAGESSDVWNVICALIPFHRASCPTQMSALHVSTDNLIKQKPPHTLWMKRHAPSHSLLQLIALIFNLCLTLSLHVQFVLSCNSLSMSQSLPSSATPSFFHPPPFLLHPSPIHCNTSIFIWN